MHVPYLLKYNPGLDNIVGYLNELSKTYFCHSILYVSLIFVTSLLDGGWNGQFWWLQSQKIVSTWGLFFLLRLSYYVQHYKQRTAVIILWSHKVSTLWALQLMCSFKITGWPVQQMRTVPSLDWHYLEVFFSGISIHPTLQSKLFFTHFYVSFHGKLSK